MLRRCGMGNRGRIQTHRHCIDIPERGLNSSGSERSLRKKTGESQGNLHHIEGGSEGAGVRQMPEGSGGNSRTIGNGLPRFNTHSLAWG